MNAQLRFVLFDFDGVIADSVALSTEVSKQFNPELDDTAYRALFEGNIYKSLEKLTNWKEDHSKKYFEVYVPRLHKEVRIAKGIDEVITTLAEGYRLAIISSTPSQAIRDFLRAFELEKHFLEILGWDIDPNKAKKMEMIFKKYEVSAEDCVYITDTLGDMHEAMEHCMGTIGCSWGVHPHKTLERGLPFRIVDKPQEIPDAVDDYFARASV